ncbi:MAG: TadA family conjugal transfer-associated ATPase [Propionibacteriaceae bacterium]|jgi:pilus assembly protein CpaF|nr:TadA family conjugal transfer-associated ATPase [Propionibacteriaceae bacterium]
MNRREDLVSQVRQHLAVIGKHASADHIAEALRSTGQVVSDSLVLAIQEGIARDSTGVGVLEPLLHLTGVTDILVNGPDQVYVDCGHGLEATDIRFEDDDAVRQLGVRLAASVGRRLDDGSPFVDARLRNGVRFHAVLGGIADPGTCLSLRVPATGSLSLDRWEELGSVDPRSAQILRRLIDKKVAFLICGGTGSGKTTLLSAMLSLVPSEERIVVVEDSRELDPCHPHVIRLESRPANGEGAGLVTMTDLVRQALRMRPDRLVVGEVRGAELRDLLQALNTGHEGGCGTVHANSVADMPARLEALAALGGLAQDATRAQVAAAIRVVVQVTRRGSGRQVSEIGVIARDSSQRLRARTALTRVDDTVTQGEAMGELTEVLS